MHDDLLERRLSAALRDEADSLPFTITAAELERRLVLRRRSFGSRRLNLLLAAAVGISLFGVGGAVSGLFDQPKPQPTHAVTSQAIDTPGPAQLASLSELVGVDPDSVLLAQAHGPAEGPSAGVSRDNLPRNATLGLFPSGSRLSVACLGPSTLSLNIGAPEGSETPTPLTIPCDGTTHDETLGGPEARGIAIEFSGPASWRIVVRGQWTVTLPVVPNPILATPPGLDELVRLDDATIGNVGVPWGSSNLDLQEIGAVPARENYGFSIWCRGSSPVRFILGNVVDGAVVPETETQVDCGPHPITNGNLGVAQPNGSRVYLAAAPGTRLSVLLFSPRPPITLTQSEPGWRISGGLGPDYEFEATRRTFGGAGVGEDHIRVVLACTGTEPVEVTVEDSAQQVTHTEHFEAACTPAGTTTSQAFTASEHGVVVSYLAPKGSWTALSILVPSN
jgi:hypothetical protein